MTPLERRYRRWMLAYPGEYRREHESEILDTLLQAAGPGQEWPSRREVVALLAGGLRTRSRLAAGSPGLLWADGLRLGVLLYLVLACGICLEISLGPFVFPGRMGIVGDAGFAYLQCALLAIGVVATARARCEIGLAAVAGFVAIDEIALHGALPAIRVVPLNWLFVALVLAALAWHPRLRAFRRPLPALPALGGVALVTATSLAMDAYAMRGPAPLALVVASSQLLVPVAILLLLAVAGADPRPALAATVYVLANVIGVAQLGFTIPLSGFQGIQYELMLLVSATAAVVALAVTALSVRRLAAL